MKYRINVTTGDKISLLGYGCMRFTSTDGVIDVERAYNEIKYAVDNGVNYIDTAYVYEGSEVVVGKVLARDGLRSKVLLATKLPQFKCKETADFDKFLSEQLERLQTTYIDYYLVHCLTSYKEWLNLKKMNIVEWLDSLKRKGTVKRVGFSFHGKYDDYEQIMKEYDWQFVQLQYNVLDTHKQAGVKGLDYAYSKGVGVIVMEPLQGGYITNKLSDKCRNYYKQLNELDGSDRSIANLSLNFVYDHPSVFTVLSGMNDIAQVKDNIKSVEDFKPLTEEQKDIFAQIRIQALSEQTIACTDCRYCLPCTVGINIPEVFSTYNDAVSNVEKMEKLKEAIKTKTQFKADACIKCGKCEGHCPQALPITSWLETISKA